MTAGAIGVPDMRVIVAVAVVVLPAAALAQPVRPKPAAVETAVDRGLAFLAKDALAWKKEHHCASCHHAALVIWAMREAKQRGHGVDEPLLAELTTWVAESGDGKFALARPAAAPQAASPKAVYFALALGAQPKLSAASQQGLTLLLKTVKAEQTEGGSWSTWPETRPPIFGNSDASLTALATLALLPAAAAGDEGAKAARDRAVRWLAETKTDDDPQSVAMRLVLWSRLGRPAAEWQPLVRRIKERQNADGGWSQTKEMASDAWATGQALYALAHAGVKPDDPAIRGGQAFLAKAQRDDGSWPMTSRPANPGSAGAKSLIPITGAGAAWAVLGLARTAIPAGPGDGGAGPAGVPTRDKPAAVRADVLVAVEQELVRLAKRAEGEPGPTHPRPSAEVAYLLLAGLAAQGPEVKAPTADEARQLGLTPGGPERVRVFAVAADARVVIRAVPVQDKAGTWTSKRATLFRRQGDKWVERGNGSTAVDGAFGQG
jgi:Prenyltransferase and squalene oxidase repeat